MKESQFELAVPAPFRLDLTVWALRRRPHNLIDRWDGTWYRRICLFDGHPAEVAVCQTGGPATPRLAAIVRSEHMPANGTAEARLLLEKTLGLDADLDGFWQMAAQHRQLASLARRFVGMRPPCFPTVFESLINAIACQQLSLEVGIHLLGRLARRYGPCQADPDSTAFGSPAPIALVGANPEELRDMGFSRAKARALTTLAGQVTDGDVNLETLYDATDDEALSVLTGLVGIGRWSAEYTLLRGLRRWHVLPGDDIGARNNLRRRLALPADAGYDAMAQLSQEWQPYGGLVYFHLLLDSLDQQGLFP